MNRNFRKTAVVAVSTALGALPGWRGGLLVGWAAVMGLDYLTGTLAACKTGSWSSTRAREGLWHKAGMITAVTASALADWVMRMTSQVLSLGLTWPGLLLPMVLAWYTVTELGSVLENAVKMGARVPGWLTKLLKIGAELVDRSAGELQNSEKND